MVPAQTIHQVWASTLSQLGDRTKGKHKMVDFVIYGRLLAYVEAEKQNCFGGSMMPTKNLAMRVVQDVGLWKAYC